MSSHAMVPVAGINIAFCILSTAATVTRLQRTFVKTRSFQIHDIMLVLALVCGLIEASLQCVMTNYGLGYAFFELSVDQRLIFDKLLTVLFVFYLLCNMFVKLSLLAFYRLLSPDNRYLWVLLTMAAAAIIFGIGSLLAFIFRCVPFAKLWNAEIEGTCINLDGYLYANAGIMIVTDVVLYILPILIVRGVQLSKAKAAAMNFLFAVGFIVVVTSVLRLFYLEKWLDTTNNELYYIGVVLIWCTVENHLAIIIVCLPAVKSVLITLAPSLASAPGSLWSSINSRRKSSAPQGFGIPEAYMDTPNTSSTSSTTDPKKTSWFNWGSTNDSADRSRISGIRMSKTFRVSTDQIELRKQPSMCIVEDGEATTSRQQSVFETDRESFDHSPMAQAYFGNKDMV